MSKIMYHIKFFKLIEFTLLALLLFIFRNNISWLLINFFEIENIDIQKKILYITPPLLFFIYFIIFIYYFFNRFYTYYTHRNYKKDKSEFQRSYSEMFRYFKDNNKFKLNLPDSKKSSWKETSGLILGKDKITRNIIAIDNLSEGLNSLILGVPGSGKTAYIICNILGFLKQKHTSKSKPAALVLDIKGDIGKYIKNYDKTMYENQFVTFNPTDINSAKYNPLEGYKNLKTDDDKKIFIENIANILIQDENPGSDGSYFVNTGRDILMGISHMLLSQNSETSFVDIVRYILNCNIFEVISFIANPETDNNDDKIDYTLSRQYLAPMLGNNERNISGAMQNLSSKINVYASDIMSAILSNKTTNTPSVSIDTLNSGISILLEIPQSLLNVYAPLVSLISQQLMLKFTNREDSSDLNNPIGIYLDEFYILKMEINTILSAVASLRSRNCSIFIITQSLSQLFALYGNYNARSLIGCFHIILVLGCSNYEDNQFLSNQIGYKKSLQISTSYSDKHTSKSVNETTEYIIEPQEITLMSKTKTGILMMNGKYALIDKLNAYIDK